MRWISLFGILLAAPCAACFAQDVRTVENPLDGSKSVQIAINARESYKRADGSPFTPILEIRCEETKSGKRSLSAILATGGVQTRTVTTHDSFSSQSASSRGGGATSGVAHTDEQPTHELKAKFDEGKPTSPGWNLEADQDHFTGPGSGFVKSLLKAQTVSINFPPKDGSKKDDVVSVFDLAGFKAEFEKHSQCNAK